MVFRSESNRLCCLVDLEKTAEWRSQVAQRHPEDERNVKAAETLYRLAPQIAAYNGSPLHMRIETFVSAGPEAASLEIDLTLKKIGFPYIPATGQQLLEVIVADLERYCRRDDLHPV